MFIILIIYYLNCNLTPSCTHIHTVQPDLHSKLLQIIGNLVHKMKRILCTVYNVLQVCTDTVHCTVQYIYIECMHNSYPPYCYCICQNI